VLEYDWPGNVRELSNFCERLCVLSEETVAGKDEVRACLEHATGRPESAPGVIDLSRLSSLSEREAIGRALESASNKREASRLLGIDPSTLWRKMKKYGLE
jgi:transcriptional regulator with PAS, ATPase and Fis domain